MGLGVLSSSTLDKVPGTATLDDLNGQSLANSLEHGKKLKRAKDGITILVPQPSDDPDDPLNWPLWRRDMITFLLCMLSVLASTLSPLMAANTLTLLTYYNYKYSITDMALLTGYHLLGVAVSGFFVVPLARVWGKRWLVLLGTVIIIISCLWAGLSGMSYNSLVAARFFQGVGLAPFEGLVNAMVGELYFVHESGIRMALSNLCLFGGAFFTPVIVGKVTASLGWPWTFFLVSIFTTAVVPFVYLYCPETTYNRDTAPDNRSLESESDLKEDLSSSELKQFGVKEVPLRSFSAETGESSSGKKDVPSTDGASQTDEQFQLHSPAQTKLITKKSLRLFSGRHTDESFFRLALRPLPLFAQPAFLWASLIQGALIAWVSMLGVSLALFTIKLGFTEVETGYMYSGAFIGAISAFAIAGLISDPAVRWLTKRNGGVFEPEFRMILVIPQLACGCGGLFGYGVVTASGTYGWLLPDVCFGLVVAGMTFGAIVSAQYIVDGYRDLTIEGFTCLLMFKNFIAFAITYQGFEWLSELGSKEMFFTFGYIQIAICVSTIPMYILGKKNRAFFARHDLLKMCYLR